MYLIITKVGVHYLFEKNIFLNEQETKYKENYKKENWYP